MKLKKWMIYLLYGLAILIFIIVSFLVTLKLLKKYYNKNDYSQYNPIISVNYIDSLNINEELKTGWSKTYNFNVSNVTNIKDVTSDYSIMLSLEDLSLKDLDITYSIQSNSLINNSYLNDDINLNKTISVSDEYLPMVSSSIGSGCINNGFIHEYSITFTLNQTLDEPISFKGKLDIVY